MQPELILEGRSSGEEGHSRTPLCCCVRDAMPAAPSLVQCLGFGRRQLFRHSIFLSSFIQQIYIEQLLWARKRVRHFRRHEDESDPNPGRTQPHTETPECGAEQEGGGEECRLDKELQLCQPSALLCQHGDDISYHNCHHCHSLPLSLSFHEDSTAPEQCFSL